MERKRYPADLTDAQWAQLVPLLIKQSGRTGRPRKHELRSVVDALLYVLRGGISWRALPHDFPPWESGRLSSRYALALCLVFAPMIAYAGIKLAYLPERAHLGLLNCFAAAISARSSPTCSMCPHPRSA